MEYTEIIFERADRVATVTFNRPQALNAYTPTLGLELKTARFDERGVTAEVIATDGPFGNLVTNLEGDDFLKLGYQRGQEVPVRVGEKQMKIKFVKTFSDVPLKQPLLYIDSRGRLGLAVNQGSFSASYGVTPPVELFIPPAGK